MGRIVFRLSLGLIAVCLMPMLFAGCTQETSLDPVAEPAKVQELRGDQATEPQAAEPATDEAAE